MNDFVINFLSNFIATILGIIIGIPIALYLERQKEKKQQIILDKERRERSNNVLKLILNELDYNLDTLQKITDDILNTYSYVRIESWKSFSDGGEIKWVDDPDVINTISISYSHIIHFILLYEKFVNRSLYPNHNTYNQMQSHVMSNYTMKAKQDAIDSIRLAKKAISDKINHK